MAGSFAIYRRRSVGLYPGAAADANEDFWHTGTARDFRSLQVERAVPGEEKKLSVLQVLGSVLSSFFGVQKDATRERDFKHGRARDFIFVGILLTVLFILAVWGVVQLVMRVATSG